MNRIPGNPAFPTPSYDEERQAWVREEGMTLRAYFASVAEHVKQWESRAIKAEAQSERDEALLRQALEAMEHLHRTGDTQVFDLCYAPELIPALRKRLGEKA